MIDMGAFLKGFSMILTVDCAIFLTFGMFVGILCGAIPGLTSTMAVAVLVPLTYTMDALTALVFLSATYVGAIYGGSITAILINTPGN